MNQKAAAELFSQRTVDGLKEMKDLKAATCVKIIGYGLSAFDESSISSDIRIRRMLELKHHLLDRTTFLKGLGDLMMKILQMNCSQ